MAAAFDLGRPDGPLVYAARGELGRVFRLDTDKGRFAVKELFLPDAPAAVAANGVFQDAMVRAGVPMPAMVRAPGGELIADLGVPVRVYTWVDIEPSGAADPIEAAAVLGRIHAASWPATGQASGAPALHPWYTEPVGEDAWARLGAAVAAAGPPWAGEFAALLPELVAAGEWVAVAHRPAPWWCHLDYNAENVRPATGGGLVVIDWENAGPLHPKAEFASALAEFSRTDEDATAMARAYAAAGVDAKLETADFATALAVDGHLVEMYAGRALQQPAGSEDQTRAASRIALLLSRPLTRARVERLVRATRR